MKDLLEILSMVMTLAGTISLFSFILVMLIVLVGDPENIKMGTSSITAFIISAFIFLTALICKQKITNSISSHTHYIATKIQVKRWRQLNSGDYKVLTTNNKIITVSYDEDKTKININTSIKYDKPHASLTKYTATNRNYLKQLDTDIPTEYYKLTINTPNKDATKV